MEPATRGPALGPLLCLQMDFLQLPGCQQFEFMLVIASLFSGWTEAYPCTANAFTVAKKKKLLNHYIPSWVIPLQLSSDRSTHFTGKVVQVVSHSFHRLYHSQSAGAVERHNGVLKNKLAEIWETTGFTWVEALPIAVKSMRATPNRATGLSPYEIGRG